MSPKVPSLMALAIAATLATPASAGTFAGWLSIPGKYNDDPIVITTNAAGSVVRSVVLAARPSCPGGQAIGFHRRAVVRTSPGSGTTLIASRNRAGHFAATLRGAGENDTYTFADGGAMTGSFSRHAAHGTLRIAIGVTDRATGATVMTCTTPRMHWKARRERGRIYGGITAQGEPVYVSLTRNRRMVYELGVDWHADCTPSGFSDRADWLTDFAIRPGTGRFGDSFGFTAPGSNRIRGRLIGRLTRKAASGTLSISVTAPGGTVCSSETFGWRATSG